MEITTRIATAAWLKEPNNTMTIPGRLKHLFPEDCFIPRGKGTENAHRLDDHGILLTYQGIEAPVRCFMELRPSGNQFRPSKRNYIRDFYLLTGAKVGDVIRFTQIGDRHYRVTLEQGE